MSDQDHKLTRRDFLKVAGAAGAVVGVGGGITGLAACGSSSTPSSSTSSSGSAAATGREIKIGFVSPLTGPLATFGALDTVLRRPLEGGRQGRHQDRRRHHPSGHLHRQGLAVGLQPCRHRGRRPHHHRRHRHHDGRLHAGHGEPGRRPGRGARRALRLQRLPVAAVLLRPRCHPGQAVQVDLPRLLGPGRRHRRLHRHVEQAHHQQARRRDVAQRRRRPRLGQRQDRPAAAAQGGRLQVHRRRPLPGRHPGLHAADLQVQVGRLSDPQRRLHPAGLRQLLEAVLPAGLQAGRSPPSARRSCSRPRWKPSAASATASPPSAGGRRAIRSSPRSPARPASSSPTTGRPRPARSGRSRCCTTPSSRSSPTRSSAPPTSTTRKPSSRPSSRPSSTPSRATSTWSGGPLNPVKNVCRTVLVGGMWVKGTQYPFDLQPRGHVARRGGAVQRDHPGDGQDRAAQLRLRADVKDSTLCPASARAYQEVTLMQGGETS